MLQSGGDFDGDTAWCCWDSVIYNEVKPCPAPETVKLVAKKSLEEQQLASEASTSDRLALALNYRKHKANLGKLSLNLDTILDSHGFASKEAKAIGESLFMQVCHVLFERRFFFLI